MRLVTENRYYKYPVKFKDHTQYQGIIYKPGIVTRIILNRPRYLNALGNPVWAEIDDAFDRAGEDKECRVIVVSGEGRCFSTGDDTMGLSPEAAPVLSDRRTPEQLIKDLGSEKAMWHQYNIEHDYFIHWVPPFRLRTVPKPTIAMVHSYCIYGAFGLASAMDLIFASEDALFLPAWTNESIGAIWDMGARKFLEAIYEHRFITAREGLEYHMVNRVYPNREILEKETLAFAERVAKQPPSRLRAIKEIVLTAMDVQGFFRMSDTERRSSEEAWQQFAKDGHPERSEGKGMARTPLALANLKAKLESEGKPVPEYILAALAKAAQRDDKGAWEKALHQEWREKGRVERSDTDVSK